MVLITEMCIYTDRRIFPQLPRDYIYTNNIHLNFFLLIPVINKKELSGAASIRVVTELITNLKDGCLLVLGYS